MMKKIIISICCICTLAVSGCSNRQPNSNNINNHSDEDASIGTSEHIEKGDVSMMNYNDVADIRIVDAVADEYMDSLDIPLKDEDIQQFISISGSFENNTAINMKKTWYTIQLSNANGTIIDTLAVDVYRTIKTSNGCKIKRVDDIDKFLSNIEKKYNISKDLLQRCPGSNYFHSINLVDKGVFQEKVETNFDDNHEFTLSNDLIETFKANINDVVIGDCISNDYDIKYVITFYNADDNVEYSLHISPNNQVYTNSGYSLGGNFIDNWVATIIKEALSS